MSGRRHALSLRENDVAMMLQAKTHLGKANTNFQMEEYIHSKRPDGIPIFDVKKVWEKILLAARVIVAVKHPADVVAISGNEQCQRAVLKFCTHTGATPIAGRFTPGTLTNQITSSFREPRLLIVSDPIIDHQPIAEARYVSIPTLAFCNTNANLKYIDVAIPCNTEQNHSIGLMWWLLAREVCCCCCLPFRDNISFAYGLIQWMPIIRTPDIRTIFWKTVLISTVYSIPVIRTYFLHPRVFL